MLYTVSVRTVFEKESDTFAKWLSRRLNIDAFVDRRVQGFKDILCTRVCIMPMNEVMDSLLLVIDDPSIHISIPLNAELRTTISKNFIIHVS